MCEDGNRSCVLPGISFDPLVVLADQVHVQCEVRDASGSCPLASTRVERAAI